MVSDDSVSDRAGAHRKGVGDDVLLKLPAKARLRILELRTIDDSRTSLPDEFRGKVPLGRVYQRAGDGRLTLALNDDILTDYWPQLE